MPGTIDTGTPQLFAEGVVSAGNASCPAFMPDGRTVYFMRESTTARQHPLGYTIMRSTYADGRWSPPVVAPFSGRHLDIDPFVAQLIGQYYSQDWLSVAIADINGDGRYDGRDLDLFVDEFFDN